jgi:large subunit ribosomal protein L4
MATTKKTTTPKAVKVATENKESNFSVFNKEVSPSLLAQAIHIYQENSHQGVSKTKTRGEIDATKHKVYKQKGTGGARHGAKSAPIFVGGGVVFGPTGYKNTPLSFNQKMKVKALLGILSLYNKEGRLLSVDVSSLSTSSTKNALNILGKDKAALVHFDESKEVLNSVSNLKNISLYSARRLNVFNVALMPKLYLTSSALNHLVSRLKLNK